MGMWNIWMVVLSFLGFVASSLGSHLISSSAESESESFFGEWRRSRRAASARQFNFRLIAPMAPNGNWSRFLLNEHNKFRRKVPASNMQMLFWDPKLTASAQAHANTCDFWHSKGRRGVGENIWAASYSDYSNAVTLWFDEVYNPQCGCPHHFKSCCGHYTQVVWAETNRVGCGAARCRSVRGAPGQRNVLVCHYSPSGNVIQARQGKLHYVQAFRWQRENATQCSECPKLKDGRRWLCDNGLCRL